FETAERKLLQVVLAGQNELRELMRREDLRQLRQRVSVRLDIVPLQPAEVEQYMRHRWHQGGGNGNFPFNPEAVDLVALWSHGIPRVMNAICDIALLRAYTSETSSIGPEVVREALGVLELTDLPPEAGDLRAGVEAAAPDPLEVLRLPAAGDASSMPLRRPGAATDAAPRRGWWNGVLQANRNGL
ncbi:MAG: hypothetical protein ABSC93_29955, partial [Bryobacteraceae bacterium]